ncbi:MAG: hypothetical protein ACYTFG_00960 [Planctomycetota bacterium]|jgi:protein-S-isoprenylcysteine O-methyltransferase Ste14
MSFIDRYADRHFKGEGKGTRRFFVLGGKTHELTGDGQHEALHRLMRLDLLVACCAILGILVVIVLMFVTDYRYYMSVFMAGQLTGVIIFWLLGRKRRRILENAPVTSEDGEEDKKKADLFFVNFMLFNFVLWFWACAILAAVIRWELLFGAGFSLICVVAAAVYKNLKYGDDGENGNGEEPENE